MRGKPDVRQCYRGGFRITPADAGKTKSYVPFLQLIKDHPRGCGENQTTDRGKGSSRDHPRGCGENIITAIAEAAPTGLPPRMRGKLRKGIVFLTIKRITPADAGKTYRLRVALDAVGDYPRGCGENFATATNSSNGAGSPPRMRGKHIINNSLFFYRGITPAGAGKTILCFDGKALF